MRVSERQGRRVRADQVEQLETDLIAAQAEIEEAISGSSKSKAELEALKQTLKDQKVSCSLHEYFVVVMGWSG